MGWVVFGAVLLLLLGVAIALLGVVLARRVVMPRPSQRVTVHELREKSVVLDSNSKTLHPGQFGLWIGESDAHVRVGEVLSVNESNGTVERALLTTVNGRVDARSGRWTGHVFSGPQDLGLDFSEIAIDSDHGPAPAWQFSSNDGSRKAWTIHVHGLRTTRITALRTVPVASAAGYVSLVPSFRGDGEGPAIKGGASTLGQTEWRDVEAAVRFAVQNGARSIVLVGWSMGASLTLLVAERSQYRHLISGLVLIAPATEWRAIVKNGVRRAHLPGFAARLAIANLRRPLLGRLTGLRVPIDFDALDWSAPRRVPVPSLVLHCVGDPEVPFELSRRFHSANPETVELVEFGESGHAWEYNLDPVRFECEIDSWLRRLPRAS